MLESTIHDINDVELPTPSHVCIGEKVLAGAEPVAQTPARKCAVLQIAMRDVTPNQWRFGHVQA